MTAEEIINALKGNGELATAVVSGIQETEQVQTLINNSNKKYWDENIGNEVAKIYSGIDEDIFSVLGVRKESNKKTYEFLKDILSEYKKVKEKSPNDPKVNELQSKIDELQAKVTELTPYVAMYTSAQEGFSKEKETLTAEIEKLRMNEQNSVILSDLNMGLSSLKFNPSIPQEAVEAMKTKVIEEIKQTAKVVDGKVVYYKADGTPWLDANNLQNPITASGIFADKLKPILDTKPSGGGANPTGTGVKKGEGGSLKVVLDPTKFNSKTSFMEHFNEVMTSNGIEMYSKDYDEAFASASKEHDYDNMSRM